MRSKSFHHSTGKLNLFYAIVAFASSIIFYTFTNTRKQQMKKWCGKVDEASKSTLSPRESDFVVIKGSRRVPNPQLLRALRRHADVVEIDDFGRRFCAAIAVVSSIQAKHYSTFQATDYSPIFTHRISCYNFIYKSEAYSTWLAFKTVSVFMLME